HELLESSRVTKVCNANTASSDLVLVGRPDSTAGGAYRARLNALHVLQLMVRKHQVCAVAHIEAPLHVDSVAHELVNLVEQRVRIENDTVADRAPDAFVHDAARDLVQHERAVADVHRMASVRTSLVPHDP